MGFRLKAMTTASIGIAVVVVAAACSSSGSGSASPSSTGIKVAPVKHGGSITVLESKGYGGDYPSGLDPATDVDAIPNQDMMEAIYGQLFMLGPGGVIQPDLATGYTFSPDAKDVTIALRQGVKFSDGTPFNAQAVVFNWDRDFWAAGPEGGHLAALERRQD
jgi:ABC-type transport system substrate-binding protein